MIRVKGLCRLSGLPKKVVGFSKGTVVLNQLVREWSTGCKEHMAGLKIETLSWIDGGHSNGPVQPTWINDVKILDFLACDTDCKIDVRVTPYQICDKKRPWIATEERHFSNYLLRKLQTMESAYRIQRRIYFEDEKASLLNHFRVLDTLKDYPLL